jgi:ABC-2 type transport system permease protein
MVVLPLVFAIFFGLVMGGNSRTESPSVMVTLTPRRRGRRPPWARRLVQALHSDRLALNEVTAEERAALANPVRTLVIPAGFSQSVLAGEKVALRLEKEPDTSAEAAMVAQTRILRAVADVLGALVVGERQGLDLADGLPVTEHPAYVSVESTTAGRARLIPGGFAQSIPGNAVMFVMLIALTYGAATVTAERQSGPPAAPGQHAHHAAGHRRRQDPRPDGGGNGADLPAGRGLPPDCPWSGSPRCRGISSRCGWCWRSTPWPWAPIGVTFGALFSDPDRAANLGVLATMAMAAFGGCWWPLEIVPSGLQKIALALPTGWAMRSAHGVISFGHPLTEVVSSLAPLVVFGVVFTVLGRTPAPGGLKRRSIMARRRRAPGSRSWLSGARRRRRP